MSHRRAIKPAYIWGALSNTEPPEDEDFAPVECGEADYIEPEYVDDDDYAASKAEDRWIAERDRTASQ